MRVSTFNWSKQAKQLELANGHGKIDLLIYFADREVMPKAHSLLQQAMPNATILGCSGGGQFSNDSLSDSPLVGAAISFDNTKVRSAIQVIEQPDQSRVAGKNLGDLLSSADLSAVIVLSDGTGVNGSEVAAGISEAVGFNVPVVGGLAGDGSDFKSTLVALNDELRSGVVAAVGLYGPSVKVSHASQGGWSAMGPKRRVSRSEGNVLFEFDGKPALELYERYLGAEAAGLPASALLFPLEVTPSAADSESVVRTILDIDRERGALIFAGNVPQGSTAQMMKASQDSLTQGAMHAARDAMQASPNGSLALLVSCIGRRLLMGQRAEEEVESACEGLGGDMPHIGFYSYGEICPKSVGGLSQLHNQTMTVSVISEVACNAAA